MSFSHSVCFFVLAVLDGLAFGMCANQQITGWQARATEKKDEKRDIKISGYFTLFITFIIRMLGGLYIWLVCTFVIIKIER